MSDSWAQNKGQPKGQQTPYQAGTGGNQSKDDGLDGFTDDMYFLNAKKYEMDATMSKMRGHIYSYNLKQT